MLLSFSRAFSVYASWHRYFCWKTLKKKSTFDDSFHAVMDFRRTCATLSCIYNSLYSRISVVNLKAAKYPRMIFKNLSIKICYNSQAALQKKKPINAFTAEMKIWHSLANSPKHWRHFNTVFITFIRNVTKKKDRCINILPRYSTDLIISTKSTYGQTEEKNLRARLYSPGIEFTWRRLRNT